MKLASFSIDGRPSWGVVEGDMILDTGAILHARYPDLAALIAAGALAELPAAMPAANTYPLADIIFRPVIPAPEKILCVGLNYEMHRQETGRAVVEHPTIFARLANSQTGHLVDVVRPKVSTELDYEGELAIVIGRAGRYIQPADAMAHVAGFSCYNDVSVRDFQRHTHQFTPGKNFPGTGVFGPWLVTPDEMGPVGPQRLQTTFTRLEPGDVIVTGTPGGVGAKRQPPLWMKPGDIVEVEIDRVGLLRNTIVAEV